jgi:AAA15 family ATPase/GTPase
MKYHLFLICVSQPAHDTNLLDLDLLRRDEVWFVEKNNRGISTLYSLAGFKVRPDLIPILSEAA